MSTPSPAPAGGGISPLDAAQQAADHTRRHLFPFAFERWLTLGFVAFLDQCGRGGGGPPIPPDFSGFGQGLGQGHHGDARLPQAAAWAATHAPLLALIVAGVLVGALAVIALAQWIGSRAAFVYLDDVTTGRADLRRPWVEHAPIADSYFAWRFLLTAITLVAVVVLVAVMAMAGLSMAQGGAGVLGALEIVAALFLLFGLLLASGLAGLALHDFVAPLQLRYRWPCGPAVRVVVDLVRGHPGTFLVYVLLRVAFLVGLGVASVVLLCVTCCLGALPVIAQTLLQPAFYFERAWSLHLLRQLGHDVMPLVPPAAPTPPTPAALPPAAAPLPPSAL